MPGENETSIVSGWTTDTLNAHLTAMIRELDKRSEQRFEDQEKSVQAAMLAAKEAVLKAENAAEKRADAANEFRAQLADQAATFMPRTETQLIHSALSARVDAVEASIERSVGRSHGLTDSWGYLVGLVGLAGGAVGIILALS